MGGARGGEDKEEKKYAGCVHGKGRREGGGRDGKEKDELMREY